MQRSPFFILVALIWMSAFPLRVLADGGLMVRIRHESDTQSEAARDGLVSSNGQRAALVELNEGGWDLYVEPGDLRAEGAAWILPLPVLPEVSAASSAFLDELDAATEPLLVEHIERTVYSSYEEWGACAANIGACGSSGGGSEGDDGLVDGTSSGPADSGVTVWGEGRLDGLGYEIVSSEDAGALAEWLETNGYAVAEGLAERIGPYVDDGYYFVATRFERDTTATTRLPTMRFRLADAELPEYPMRLTTLSMGAELDFLLWVAALKVADGEGLSPANSTYGVMIGFDTSPQTTGSGAVYGVGEFVDAYNDSVELALESHAPRALVVQFHAAITRSDIEMRVGGDSGFRGPHPLHEESGTWSSELVDIIERGHIVARYRGRFAPAGMDEDVLFERGAALPADRGIYERTLQVERWGDGTEYLVEQRAARRRGLTAGSTVLALLLLGLSVGLRRRSRACLRGGGAMKRSVFALVVVLLSLAGARGASAGSWKGGVGLVRLGGGSYGAAFELGAATLRYAGIYLDLARFGAQFGAPYESYDHGTHCMGRGLATYVGPSMGYALRLDNAGRHRLALGAMLGYGYLVGPLVGNSNHCEHGEFSGLVVAPEVSYQYAWWHDGGAVELGLSSLISTGLGEMHGYPAPSLLLFVGLRDL